MIKGVDVKKLRVFPDERGRLMEILRKDDALFQDFGQVYMTTTYPGIVKAWHKHEKQTDNVACIQGMIKLALYDPRPDSPTFKKVNQFFIGIHNPLLVQIPPGVYHGWMGISEEEAIIVNIPTHVYNYKNPDEQRLDPHNNDIPYDWTRKDG
ncbi:MAG: dTDP-4-dehydrorhamnose 3,5-epimerase family protein [Candidatus Aminicenantes bacterium]|nr:dTDP-4-dehydrorhamnose 3,5-epimerase family protein [Candidatus Aminicenantes bacterium]